MQGFPLIINFIIMPIFFFSGAIFASNGLPKVLKILLRLNPLSYGVDGLRGACSTVFAYGLTVDLAIGVVLTGLLLALGSYFFSKIQL
jgi:ABC-2 type transport system permease protein